MFKRSKFASVAMVFLSVGNGMVRFHSFKCRYLFQNMESPYQVVQNTMEDNEYKTKMVVVHLEQYEKYSYF